MKVSFVQMNPDFGEKESNLRRANDFINELKGSDLIVLPELFSTGYNFSDSREAYSLSEPVSEGETVEFLKGVAKEEGAYFAGGLCERDGENLYNSAVLVGPEGLVGSYRKVHLFSREKDIFAKGDLGFPVFETEQGKIGLLICFDWIFPEAWRILALKGADIVCHPANLVLKGFCQQAIPVHSLINRYFIITANRTGKERGLNFTGSSIVSGTKGEILAMASEEGEEVATVDIDITAARDKRITDRNDILKDRFPKDYKLLTERL